MKRWIVPTLAILAINVLVATVFKATMDGFFARGRPILDPLLLVASLAALPVAVVQPWMVVAGKTLGGVLGTALPTTCLSVLIYVGANRGRWLATAWRGTAFLRTWKAIAIVGAAVVVLLGYGLANHVDFPVRSPGVPFELRRVVGAQGITPRDSRYYRFTLFIDSEAIWRATVSEGELVSLAQALDMHPQPASEVSEAFLDMPPYWWRPVLSAGVRVLSTGKFPTEGRGPDGFHVLAVWNRDDRVLYMWVKNQTF